MTESDFDLSAPELSRDDLLELDDPRFHTDNVALITGAASGIGKAVATGLATNGLTVVGADIDTEGMEETAQQIESFDVPGRFLPVETELTDQKEIAAVVEAAAGEGSLRYVANIAGLQHIDPFAQFPTEKYDLLQDVMIRAPFLITREAIPYIEETDDSVGAIANMCSVHGHYATHSKPAYIIAKHALNGLTRATAAEGGGDLRSFTVSVGYVLTPLMVNQIEDTAEERGISKREVVEDVMLGQARTKEMMTPADVANLFTFGLSGHSKHLNGGDMLWDGGFTNTYE